MPDKQHMLKRQQALADFGDLALRSEDLDEVLTEACRLVGEALGTHRAKILEIQEGGNELLVRAGVGWPPGVVGHVRLRMSVRSSETFSIREGRPVVSQDISKEDRFDIPDFMKQAGVVAMVNVPIFVPGRKPYGLLQVDADEPREFGQGDIEFLRTYTTILGPVIDRFQKVRRLRTLEEQQRMTLQLVPAMLWSADPVGNITSADQRWKDETGQRDTEVQDFGWLDAVHPDDREATAAAFRHAFATGEPLERQQRIRVADGSHRWHLVRHVPVHDGSGAIVRWFGAAIDVHDLHELQDRQQILVAELQHRTLNLMAVVQAMFQDTLQSSGDLDAFTTNFSDRLTALARVQGLLSRLGEGDRVTFDVLIRDEMRAIGAPSEGGKVTLDGPAGIALRSSTVQTFALAIHELATNALKYGALNQPGGRLAVRWRLAPAGPDRRPWLHVEWHESGVEMPPAGAAPQGTGQGRQLIEHALPYQLGAITTYVMASDGVRCTIALPVSSRMAAEETDDDRIPAP